MVGGVAEKEKENRISSTQDPISAPPYTINIHSKTFRGEIIRMKEINSLLAHNSRAKVTSAKVTSVMRTSRGLQSDNPENRTISCSEVKSPYVIALEGGLLEVVESISEQYPFYSFSELRSAKGGNGMLLMIMIVIIIL